MTNKLSVLHALCPLDGRYLSKTKPLRQFFSEKALAKYRIFVELKYLAELLEFLNVGKLSQKQKHKLFLWQENLQDEDILKLKKVEKEIKHDVKAVEYFISDYLGKNKLSDLSCWIHWGLTSEDVNNLAYGLMFQEAKNKIILPEIKNLLALLTELGAKYKNIAMPARTHGQIALPTTAGKELIVFASRIADIYLKVKKLKLRGKLNGAVGNFNSQHLIFPHKDWIGFSSGFVSGLGLEPELISIQTESYSSLIFLFDLLKELSGVLTDLCQDMWRYISDDYFVQTVNEKEVGSSTMPHKINPIDFENAEGNLGLAIALFEFFARKLSVSRLQRDLSDSTVKRSIGMGFGYLLLSLQNIQKGLSKVRPNTAFLQKQLNSHPEMLSEAIQLYLKTKSQKQSYELLKQATRGKKVSVKKMTAGFSAKDRKVFDKWQAEKYIGLAPKLTELKIRQINQILKEEE